MYTLFSAPVTSAACFSAFFFFFLADLREMDWDINACKDIFVYSISVFFLYSMDRFKWQGCYSFFSISYLCFVSNLVEFTYKNHTSVIFYGTMHKIKFSQISIYSRKNPEKCLPFSWTVGTLKRFSVVKNKFIMAFEESDILAYIIILKPKLYVSFYFPARTVASNCNKLKLA